MVYLDNAASTPISYEVRNKLNECLDIFGNPSSLHNEGIKAKELINASKSIISKSINCLESELYFTTGATMSNNIVLQGFKGNCIVSAIEHEDIQLIANAYNMSRIPVDTEGRIVITELKHIINDTIEWSSSDEPILVCIQAANSEIGTIQDIEAISKLVHSYPNVYLYMDVTQYIPHYPIDVKRMGIDAFGMSGQKIGCIKGTGLLYLSERVKGLIKPLIYGAQGLIGGTENVPGIACMGEAFKWLKYDHTATILELRNLMIDGLNGELIGSRRDRLPNNVNMLFDNVDSQSLVIMLNEKGICCSAGSACSSGNAEPSATLLALGLSPKQANSCVRFTLGEMNTKEEIMNVIPIINDTVDFLRGFNE